jgi:hypothetical protein
MVVAFSAVGYKLLELGYDFEPARPNWEVRFQQLHKGMGTLMFPVARRPCNAQCLWTDSGFYLCPGNFKLAMSPVAERCATILQHQQHSIYERKNE